MYARQNFALFWFFDILFEERQFDCLQNKNDLQHCVHDMQNYPIL